MRSNILSVESFKYISPWVSSSQYFTMFLSKNARYSSTKYDASAYAARKRQKTAVVVFGFFSTTSASFFMAIAAVSGIFVLPSRFFLGSSVASNTKMQRRSCAMISSGLTNLNVLIASSAE